MIILLVSTNPITASTFPDQVRQGRLNYTLTVSKCSALEYLQHLVFVKSVSRSIPSSLGICPAVFFSIADVLGNKSVHTVPQTESLLGIETRGLHEIMDQ